MSVRWWIIEERLELFLWDRNSVARTTVFQYFKWFLSQPAQLFSFLGNFLLSGSSPSMLAMKNFELKCTSSDPISYFNFNKLIQTFTRIQTIKGFNAKRGTFNPRTYFRRMISNWFLTIVVGELRCCEYCFSSTLVSPHPRTPKIYNRIVEDPLPTFTWTSERKGQAVK